MEEDFPRGQAVDSNLSKPNLERKSKRSLNESESSRRFPKKPSKREFDESSASNFDSGAAKKRKISSKFVKDKFENVWSDALNEKVINTNFLALGCIISVLEFEIRVELVDGVSATVPISAVSDDLSNLLKDKKMAAEIFGNDGFRLSRIFRPGQLLIVRISENDDSSFNGKSKKVSLGSKKRHFAATTNPKDVNENLIFTSMEPGQVLMASIKSIEEKGFVMELGSRLSGFLPFSASSLEPSRALIGQVLMCSVTEEVDSQTRVVQLSSQDSLAPPIFSSEALNRRNQLLPGLRLIGKIEKIVPEKGGLFVNFGGKDFLGFISKTKMKCPFDLVTSYEAGDDLECTVTYFTPNSNVIGFSAQTHINEKFAYLNRDFLFGGFQLGDQCRGVAKIVSSKRHGVYFELENAENEKFSAFCPNFLLKYQPKNDKDVDEKGEDAENDENNARKYKPGSKHHLRITGFSLMNRLLYVSDSKSILNQPIVDVEHAVPGILVEATVVRVNDKGITVKLYNVINGFVPKFYVDDFSGPKLRKKFAIGKSFKARVLLSEVNKNRLILTAKKSQVKSPHPIISSFDPDHIGTASDGIIVHVTANGLLVAFYNNVKGYINLNEFDEAEKTELTKNFVCGQILTVRVESVDQQRKKMQLKLDGTVYNLQKSARKTETSISTVDFHTSFEATIIEKVAGRNCLRIKADVSGVSVVGNLPAYHLTDTVTDSALLASTFKIGDKIGPCVVFARGSVWTISAKQKIVEAMVNKTNPTSFDQLEEGSFVVGVVAKVHPDLGYFVELPGGNLSGLVPFDNVDQSSDGGSPSVLSIGQTVVGRVQKINVERRRFRLTLKLSECLRKEDGLKTSIDLLTLYLNEQRKIHEFIRKNLPQNDLKRMIVEELGAVGSVVDCLVNNVTDFGLICTLKNGVKGVAVNEHLGDSAPRLKENARAEAVITRLDLQNSCVELSFLPDLVKRMKLLQKKKEDIEKLVVLDQKLRALVILSRNDTILVSLLDHAEGLFAFMPGRLHFNDIFEPSRYKSGSRISVIVKEKFIFNEKSTVFLVSELKNQKIYARQTLQANVSVSHDQNNDQPIVNPLKHIVSVQPGKIYDSQVLSIENDDFYINLFLTKSQLARIHVSELADDFTDGARPLADLTIGHPLRVKVIDFRKSPIDKSIRIAECSAKSSKILSKNNKRRNLAYRSTYTKGETICAFVDGFKNDTCQFVVDPDWRGFASLADLSNDINVLKQHKDYFARGRAFHCYIVSVQSQEMRLRLSLLHPNDRRVHENKPTVARIVSISKGDPIRFSLVDGSRAIFDNFDETHENLSSIKVGDFCLVKPIALLNGHQWRVSVLADQAESSSSIIDSFKDHVTSDKSDLPRLQVEGGFSWKSDRFSMKNLIQIGLEKKQTFEQDDQIQTQIDGSSKNVEETEKVDETPKAKKPKLEKSHASEEELLQKELALLHPERSLENEEDFDRLLMGSPDSSELWLRYMAMFVQTDEISKARLVAERALKTISLREENERFNIWTALLNLENAYGTPESMKNVFDRAKQVNEPFKVYRQLLKVFQRSGKIQEADELLDEMLKKFRTEFDVWILAGEHFYSLEPRRFEKSREILKRALKSSVAEENQQKKVDLISRFAQMEFKYADSERGRTLFESLLNEYPKRMDIWSVYADMVIKYRNPEEARVIFERATSLKLPVHKLKTFFQKWLEFEGRFGNEEAKNQVQVRLDSLTGNKQDNKNTPAAS